MELQALRDYAKSFEATIDDPFVYESAFKIVARGRNKFGEQWCASATGRTREEAAQNLFYGIEPHKREFDSRQSQQKELNASEAPVVLSDVEALLRARFPHHSVSHVRVGTQSRFILTKPGKSRMFAVSDTAIAAGNKHSLATSALESGAIGALDEAASDQVIVLLDGRTYRVDSSQ